MEDLINDGSNNINLAKMETAESYTNTSKGAKKHKSWDKGNNPNPHYPDLSKDTLAYTSIQDTQSSKIDDIKPIKIIDDNKMMKDQIIVIVSLCKNGTSKINHLNTTQVAMDQWISSQSKKDELIVQTIESKINEAVNINNSTIKDTFTKINTNISN